MEGILTGTQVLVLSLQGIFLLLEGPGRWDDGESGQSREWFCTPLQGGKIILAGREQCDGDHDGVLSPRGEETRQIQHQRLMEIA